MTYEIDEKVGRKNYSNLIYFILGCWSVIYIIKVSMIDSISGIDSVLGKIIVLLRIITILIALVDCIQNRLNKRKFLILVGFVGIVVIGYIVADHWLLFDSFFIAYFFGEQLKYKKILKIFGLTMFLSMLLVVLLDFMDFLPTFNYYSSRTGELRTRLGFGSPGVMAECLMALIFIIYILHYEDHKILVSALMIASAVWCYIYPNSITVSVVLILVLLLRFIFEKLNPNSVNKKKIVLTIFMVFTIVITIFMFVFLNTSIIDNIPFFKTYHTVYARLILGRQGLSKYGITLFGTPYKNVADVTATSVSDYFVLDCLYYLLPIRYGIITTLCFGMAYFMSVKKALDKEDFCLLSIFAATVVMSIIGSFVTMFPISYIFICAYSKKSVRGIKKKKRLKGIRLKI